MSAENIASPVPEQMSDTPYFVQPENPYWREHGLTLVFTKKLPDHGRVQRAQQPDGTYEFVQTSSGTDKEKGWGFGAIANAESRYANLHQLADQTGVNFDGIAFPERIPHGDTVVRVDEPPHGEALPPADALITNNPEVSLLLWGADCPIGYVWDETTGARGLVHMSTKTVSDDIIAKTLNALQAAYGTEPADCRVWVGPGANDLELGADGNPAHKDNILTWAASSPVHQQHPLDLEGYVKDEPGTPRGYIDLQRICAAELELLGVPAEAIERAEADTYQSVDPTTGRAAFPSYRRDGAGNPNAGALFGLRATA